MKIVHIISSLRGGGRERRLVQLAKGLSSRTGVEQVILVLTREEECPVDYPEVYAYARIIHLQNASRKALFKDLRNHLVDIKPAVVHDWTGVPLVLFALSLFKHRLKFKYVEGFIADGNPVKSIQARVMNRVVFLMSDSIVSNSHAGLLAKHAPLSKSHVFYNGFDFTRLQRVTEEGVMELREELGIKGSVKLISMLARHEPAKDWETFLTVAQAMADIDGNVVFLAVGKGSQLEQFEKDVSSMGLKNVKVLGFRSDAERIIAASRITLLFSNEKVHAEGVSNAIMESMAAGVPVIASAGGGTSEIIDDGVNGYIVKLKDISMILSKIQILLYNDDEYCKMSQKACEKIKSRFNLNLMVSQYFDLYYSLLHK